jgi:hypothetical protein
MQNDAVLDLCGITKGFGGAINKIAGIGWQRRLAAGQLDSAAGPLKSKAVIYGHWMHHRFKLMKAIRPFAKSIQ